MYGRSEPSPGTAEPISAVWAMAFAQAPKVALDGYIAMRNRWRWRACRHYFREVAGDLMAGTGDQCNRNLLSAPFTVVVAQHSEIFRATCVEDAASRRIKWAGKVALQQGTFPCGGLPRIGDWHRGQ